MSSKVCMILVWFFVICLLVVGLVMVSSTAAWAEETKHPYEPLFKQTAFACAGLVGAMILSRIDYRIWRKYIWWILGGACFLLVLCYVPGIGKEINGERRWITIGMQFQPSECAKLCMMMALANWLALYRDRTTSFWWGFVMPGLIFGIPLALILFEKDMGTSVALALAAFCVMFVAGTRKIYLAGLSPWPERPCTFWCRATPTAWNVSWPGKTWTPTAWAPASSSTVLPSPCPEGGWTGWAWETARKNTARFPLPTRTSFSRRWERNSVFTGPCSSCSAIS